MILLALETSCDETSAAVVRDGRVLSSAVSSQIKVHAEYGGVVPELAAREHLRNLIPVVQTALREAKIGRADPALRARTRRLPRHPMSGQDASLPIWSWMPLLPRKGRVCRWPCSSDSRPRKPSRLPCANHSSASTITKRICIRRGFAQLLLPMNLGAPASRRHGWSSPARRQRSQRLFQRPG